MTTVSILNADFVKKAIKTYYGRTTFMYKWDLDVPYDVSPQRIQELIVKLRELILSKPEVNKEMCWIYLQRLDRYSTSRQRSRQLRNIHRGLGTGSALNHVVPELPLVAHLRR